MKNIFLTIGIVFIIVNSVIGFIFSSYTTFNWLTSNTVILINTLFLHYISNSKIIDHFYEQQSNVKDDFKSPKITNSEENKVVRIKTK